MDKIIRVAPGNLSEIAIHNIIKQNSSDIYFLEIILPRGFEGIAQLRFAKSDNTWHDSVANIEGNKITYEMKPEDYDKLGLLKCYVRIFSESGGIYTPLLIKFTGVRRGDLDNE